MSVNINLEKAAVFSVHMENDVVLENGKLGDFLVSKLKKRNVIQNSTKLLQAVRSTSQQIPIFHMRVCYPPDLIDVKVNSQLLSLVKQRKGLVEGTWGTEFVEGLEPLDHEHIINHQRVVPFHGTDLENTLVKLEIESLIIFGVATNVAVEGTARLAGDKGYTVYIVEDCCSAATVEAHKEAINTLSLLTNVVSLGDMLLSLNTTRV